MDWSHLWNYIGFKNLLKFIYIFWEGHEICKIFTLLLSVCTVDKSKMKFSQNFAAFSEYTNFNISYSKLEIEAKKNFFWDFRTFSRVKKFQVRTSK